MMVSCNPTTARVRLHEWVVAKNGRIAPAELTDDTPILARRVVTSLQIMDLIFFIERLRGLPLDVRRIKPGSFRSINAIMESFFEEDLDG
jgi:hypothetical protein